MDASAAKQFFISKVIAEAEFERMNLSEVEKKMLYFTEAQPSLPDLYEVNAEFERDYNSDEYETGIAKFLKNARDRDSRSFPGCTQDWKDALDVPKTGGPLHSGLALLCLPRIPQVLSADAPCSRLRHLHRDRNRRSSGLYWDCHMEEVAN